MDQEETEARHGERKRRSAYLVAGGVLSLLLPLLGALYLKLREAPPPAGAVDASAVFAHREGPAARVQPAGAPTAPMPAPAAVLPPASKPAVFASSAAGPSESGLSMIRGGQDYYQEPAKAPPPAAVQPAPAPAPVPKPIPQPKSVPPASQPFTFAKLKPSAGFGTVKSWFSGGQSQPPPPAGQAPMPSAGTANGMPDVSALMKAAGGAPGTAPAPATPDINALLKSMQSGGSSPNPQ